MTNGMAIRKDTGVRVRRRYETDFPEAERRRAFGLAIVGFCLCAAVAFMMAYESRALALSAQSLPAGEAADIVTEAARTFSRSLIVIAGGLILLGVGNYSSVRRSRRLTTLLFCILAITLCTDAVLFEKLALSSRTNLEVGLLIAAIDIPFLISAGVVLWLIAKMRAQERRKSHAGALRVRAGPRA